MVNEINYLGVVQRRNQVKISEGQIEGEARTEGEARDRAGESGEGN